MGAEARLAYGYDLGGGELPEGWQVTQTDARGRLDVPWWDPEGVPTLAEQAADHLAVALKGVTRSQIDGHAEAYYAALADLDVELMRYGHQEHGSGYVLAHQHSIDYAVPSHARLLARLDYPSLPDRRRWVNDLQQAREALGLTTVQGTPGWILAAFYG